MVTFTESLAAMKEAKTAREMVESWSKALPPGPGRNQKSEDNLKRFGFYCDRAPQLIETFCHKPLVQVWERGVLDPKTRELVIVAILAGMKSLGGGIIFHIQGALQNGATEEEILEVMFLAAYEGCKSSVAATGALVAEGFRRATKK